MLHSARVISSGGHCKFQLGGKKCALFAMSVVIIRVCSVQQHVSQCKSSVYARSSCAQAETHSLFVCASPAKGGRLAQSDIKHAYSCIIARCQEMLDQMPTSLMEDVALLVCSSPEGAARATQWLIGSSGEVLVSLLWF